MGTTTDTIRRDERGTIRRVAGAWIVPFAMAFYLKLFMVPLLARWGIPGIGAQLVLGGAVVVTLALPFLLLHVTRHTDDYGEVRLALRPVRLAFTCAFTFVVAGVLAEISAQTPPFGGYVAWAIGAVSAWIYAYGAAVDARLHMFGRLLRAHTLEDARELADLCLWLLDDDEHKDSPPFTDDERTLVTLNLAGALITLSARNDDRDWLGEALMILDDLLASLPPPPLAFLTAELMVEAQQVKDQRTGDDVGWDEALDVLDLLAADVAHELPEAPSVAEAAWAVRLDRAASKTADPADRQALHERAAVRLKAAVAMLPEGADARSLHVTELAGRQGERGALGDELDTAILACRKETRRLRLVGSDDRWAAFLKLADLYSKRAALPGRRNATADVLRAYLLCFSTALFGNRGPEARRRIPLLSSLALEAIGLGRFRLGTPSMYERVFAEQMQLSSRDAAAVSVDWAAWAVRRGDADQAAEASWRWVTAATADLRGRVTHDKEARIAAVQRRYFEAATRLVSVGRLADAALALELGRAVLLTERMGRYRESLAERLALAGHTELAERWSAVGPEIERADRAGFGDAEAPQPPPGYVALASPEYVAIAEHERLLGEIAELEGFEDVDAPIDYEQLRLAAADGPLVYLLACEQDGLALIVTAEARAPMHVALPALGVTRVEADVRMLRALDALPATKALLGFPKLMMKMLPALWTDALAPLAPHFSSGALVTLVPLGGLGELPLHAAGTHPDAHGVWRDVADGIVFRYAPNGRVLLGARRRASALAQRAGAERLMSAAVPDAPGQAELRHALGESQQLVALFGAENTQAPQPADTAAVLPALEDCTIWHFACHGRFDAHAPLDSVLQLHDRPVTLREILAQPRSEARVALLSACQTARLGDIQPDEVTTFPSAMLQAGAAGVVSCMAVVDDQQAKLLMLAFAVRYRAGVAPARALADAQAWLRTATNAELHEAFSDACPLPDPHQRNLVEWLPERPFLAPGTWAAFSYTGA